MDHDDRWILFRLQDLKPKRFEELCCALLTAEGHEVRHVGAAGNDGGIDISTTAPDGARWVIQCKRYEKISPSQAGPEITKVIENPPNLLPTHYRLVATCAVSRAVDEDLEARAAKAPFPLEVGVSWDATRLIGFLRDTYPNLREQFISSRDPLPFWNVPARNEFFTGREDLLEELEARLKANSAAALTQRQTITGLGGIGKTQIAIEYCHRYRSAFEGGVFWLDASSPESLLVGYAALAVDLGKVGRDVPAEDAARAFLQHLAQSSGWLVVLDNADEPVDIRPLLPPTTGGQVLITTRAQKPALGKALPLPVDVWPLEQATQFLLARAAREEGERSDAEELAEALDGLPLALEQAGAFLAHQHLTIREYLDEFRKLKLELFDLQGPEEGTYEKTVASTWELSFQKVEHVSAAAAEALEACAFLAPQGIPLELFTTTGDRLGPHLGALAEQTTKTAISTKIIEPITRYSLARYDDETRELSIHRLVQQVIRQRLQKENRNTESCEVIYKALNNRFPRNNGDPTTWSECARWLPHVQANCMRWPVESKINPTALWQWAGHYASAAGRASEALRLQQAALQVCKRILGEEHRSTLISMNNLAATLWKLGEAAEARKLQEATLRVRQRILGEEHPDTLISMNNLAATLWALGEAAEARKLHEGALQVNQQALGKEHPNTLKSMNNLASTLLALGEAAEARKLHEAALKVCKRVFGEEHPNTLKSMNNLALTLSALGEAAEARKLHEAALKGRQRALGEEHPDTLFSAHWICFNQAETDGMDVDPDLLQRLLEGVAKLPPGTPVRKAAEARWLPKDEDSD